MATATVHWLNERNFVGYDGIRNCGFLKYLQTILQANRLKSKINIDTLQVCQ